MCRSLNKLCLRKLMAQTVFSLEGGIKGTGGFRKLFYHIAGSDLIGNYIYWFVENTFFGAIMQRGLVVGQLYIGERRVLRL